MAEETSKTTAGAQEQGGQSVATASPSASPTGRGAQGGAGATNLPAQAEAPRQPAASEARPAAQEQAAPAAAPSREGEGGGGISEAERQRRLEQSVMDKAVAQARAEFARLERLRQEQQRLATMDDAELGAEVRRRQEMEAYAQSVRARDLEVLREQTLAIVRDEKAREAVAEQERAGKFRSYSEFLRACVDAQLESDTAKLRAKLEKEVREAVTKELVAQQTEGGPQLGSGSAIATLTLADIKRMSPEEINRRWDEVQAALSKSK